MTSKGVLAPLALKSDTGCKLLHPISLHDYSTNWIRDYPEAGLDAVGDVVRL